jgi:hypothetical protein
MEDGVVANVQGLARRQPRGTRLSPNVTPVLWSINYVKERAILATAIYCYELKNSNSVEIVIGYRHVLRLTARQCPTAVSFRLSHCLLLTDPSIHG